MGLYDDVAALDRGIADRWKTRVRGKMDRPVLTTQDIDYIVHDIVLAIKSKKDVTKAQGEALILISNASIEADDTKSMPGIDRLRHYVNLWDKALRLNLQLAWDSDFPNFVNALGNELISRIMFKSPGTKITYAPFDYQAVGQLIKNKEISVFYSSTGGLSEYARDRGSYRTSSNIMVLTHIMGRRYTLIHEATHVIQDWMDVKSLIHHEEADAFIAEHIALFSTFAEMPHESEFNKSTVEGAALAAARMVIEKKAIDGDKAWNKCYEDVVAAVAKRYNEPGYSKPVDKGEGNREKTRYQEILKGIADARKKAA